MIYGRENYKTEYNKRAWIPDTIHRDDMNSYCGLIIENEDWGVDYSNQSGGMACTHPVARGIFIPILVNSKIDEFCYNTIGPFSNRELHHYINLFEENRDKVFKPIEEYLGYNIMMDTDSKYICPESDGENIDTSYDEYGTQEAWFRIICKKNHDATEGILKHWKHEEFKAIIITINSD